MVLSQEIFIELIMLCLPNSAYRRIIERNLPTDVDVTAFCVDYFPDIAQRLSSGMETTQKVSIIIQSCQKADLIRCLIQKKGEIIFSEAISAARENASDKGFPKVEQHRAGQSSVNRRRAVWLLIILISVMLVLLLTKADTAHWRRELSIIILSKIERDPEKLLSDSEGILLSESEETSLQKIEEAIKKAHCVLLMKSASTEQKQQARLIMWAARQRETDLGEPLEFTQSERFVSGLSLERREDYKHILSRARRRCPRCVSTSNPITLFGAEPVEGSELAATALPAQGDFSKQKASPLARNSQNTPSKAPPSLSADPPKQVLLKGSGVCIQEIEISGEPIAPNALNIPLKGSIAAALNAHAEQSNIGIQFATDQCLSGYQIKISAYLSDRIEDQPPGLKIHESHELSCIVEINAATHPVRKNLESDIQARSEGGFEGKSSPQVLFQTYKKLCQKATIDAFGYYIRNPILSCKHRLL